MKRQIFLTAVLLGCFCVPMLSALPSRGGAMPNVRPTQPTGGVRNVQPRPNIRTFPQPQRPNNKVVPSRPNVKVFPPDGGRHVRPTPPPQPRPPAPPPRPRPPRPMPPPPPPRHYIVPAPAVVYVPSTVVVYSAPSQAEIAKRAQELQTAALNAVVKKMKSLKLSDGYSVSASIAKYGYSDGKYFATVEVSFTKLSDSSKIAVQTEGESTSATSLKREIVKTLTSSDVFNSL